VRKAFAVTARRDLRFSTRGRRHLASGVRDLPATPPRIASVSNPPTTGADDPPTLVGSSRRSAPKPLRNGLPRVGGFIGVTFLRSRNSIGSSKSRARVRRTALSWTPPGFRTPRCMASCRGANTIPWQKKTNAPGDRRRSGGPLHELRAALSVDDDRRKRMAGSASTKPRSRPRSSALGALSEKRGGPTPSTVAGSNPTRLLRCDRVTDAFSRFTASHVLPVLCARTDVRRRPCAGRSVNWSWARRLR
jgi:hypothetical protein